MIFQLTNIYELYFAYYRIPANYREFVYCTAISGGDQIEWEFASTQLDKEQYAGERANLQKGMSCTKQPWLISRYLNDHLNATKYRTQEISLGLMAISSNSYAVDRTWSFLRQYWAVLRNK